MTADLTSPAPCLFCRIAAGEIPARILYRDQEILAFEDIQPEAPVHFLVIPLQHIPTVMDVPAEHSALLGRLLWRAQELAKEKGLEAGGARFVLNCKEDGGQTVDHLHLHVLGGRPLHWPPG